MFLESSSLHWSVSDWPNFPNQACNLLIYTNRSSESLQKKAFSPSVFAPPELLMPCDLAKYSWHITHVRNVKCPTSYLWVWHLGWSYVRGKKSTSVRWTSEFIILLRFELMCTRLYAVNIGPSTKETRPSSSCLLLTDVNFMWVNYSDTHNDTHILIRIQWNNYKNVMLGIFNCAHLTLAKEVFWCHRVWLTKQTERMQIDQVSVRKGWK